MGNKNYFGRAVFGLVCTKIASDGVEDIKKAEESEASDHYKKRKKRFGTFKTIVGSLGMIATLLLPEDFKRPDIGVELEIDVKRGERGA